MIFLLSVFLGLLFQEVRVGHFGLLPKMSFSWISGQFLVEYLCLEALDDLGRLLRSVEKKPELLSWRALIEIRGSDGIFPSFL